MTSANNPPVNPLKLRKPIRIAVVDDDQDDREFLRFLFHNHEDFELVSCMKSGSEAIETVQSAAPAPEVFLIDLYMPGMTGIETIQHLRQEIHIKESAFFIISSAPESSIEKLAEMKVEYLNKPANLVELNDLPGVILQRLNLPDSHRL